MAERKNYYCEKCGHTMDGVNFYSSNNLEKYPTGKINMCKKCLTMHIDNYNPDTYLWILQELDVPYIPEKWYETIEQCHLKGTQITGATILGKYLSKMKLNQWKKYRWKDTEFLKQQADAKKEQAMIDQGYGAAEIAAALEKTAFSVEDVRPPGPEIYESSFEAPEDAEAADSDIDLTEEDRLYLRLKWGKAYKPEEWIKLEQLYNEMMESYDIQTAGHIDTLKLICKTSLKANQLIDINDKF